MRRFLALALLLPLSGSALAKPKNEPPPPPPPASAPAPSTKDAAKLEKARTEAFAAYQQELSTGQKARAADALVELINDQIGRAHV